jgi:pilus assembly protein CpaF
MFAIIITEKGGNERREVFDRTELSIGRVQNNELVLPKGNVSKHHARLLYRDNRFIVMDLKSTNGTYVNGRKIAQATIVREGDKIFIGDFILRVEVPSQGAAASPSPLPEERSERISSTRSPSMREVPPPSRPPLRRGPEPVSHYPLEHDPDDQSWSGEAPPAPQVPPPGPGPSPLRMPAPPRIPIAGGRIPSSPTSTAQPGSLSPTSPHGPGNPASHPHPSASSQELGFGSPETVQIPAQAIAVASLVESIEKTIDLKILNEPKEPPKPLVDRIERALQESAASLRASGEIAPQIDLEATIKSAREELLGLGNIGPLLDDDDVMEVRIHRHSWVSSLRTSGLQRIEIPFASVTSLERMIRRLCFRANAPLADGESIVERRVQPGNAKLIAALAPIATSGPVALIRKNPTTNVNFEDLVRSGTMSRAMSSFLTSALAGHMSILVTIALGADAPSIVGSLLGEIPPNQHVVVAREPDCQWPLPNNATSILAPPTEEGAAAIRMAARIAPDCLFITNSTGLVMCEALDAIVGGCDSVVAVMRSPSLQHAIIRVVPEIAGLRPGLPIDAIREWLNASFDLAVEVARLRDGRTRITRIAEPAGVEGNTIALRDVFSFSVERTASGGSIEGSFHPSGVMPKAAESLQARGIALDPALFRR